jgi:hypothetical protein
MFVSRFNTIMHRILHHTLVAGGRGRTTMVPQQKDPEGGVGAGVSGANQSANRPAAQALDQPTNQRTN